MTTNTAPLTLILRPGLGLPHQETLWGERLDDRYFRLLMSSFHVPLAVGDIVEAHRDDYEQLTLTGVCEPSHETLAMTRRAVPLEAATAHRLSRRWMSRGAAWAEIGPRGLNTAWSAGRAAHEIHAAMIADLADQADWLEPRVYGHTERTTRSLATWAHLS